MTKAEALAILDGKPLAVPSGNGCVVDTANLPKPSLPIKAKACPRSPSILDTFMAMPIRLRQLRQSGFSQAEIVTLWLDGRIQ